MRLLADWIDEFMQVTAHLPSPELFRKWGAISTIAGVLERKVWVRSSIGNLYPNLYVVLVGPPGVGKTVVTAAVEDIWRTIGKLHIAPKSLTKPSLIDALKDATRTKTIIGEGSLHLSYNSLLVNAGELGVLIPQYDSDFMNILTDIYDGRVYEERRRSKDLHITIKNPQLNIIAATTPSYLNATLPEGAWDQGFLSRTFLIFSGESSIIDLFGDFEEVEGRMDKLRSDIRMIEDIAGQFALDLEAKVAFSEWHLAGGEPRPEHPKLVHYNTRRSAHLLKLCMVASVSRASDRVIRLADYQRAMGWMLEAEAAMTDIFKALGSRGDGQTIEEAWHFLYNIYMASKEPVAEHRLVNFLAERVPAYNILRIVDIMERAGYMEKKIGAKGHFGWQPRPKRVA